MLILPEYLLPTAAAGVETASALFIRILHSLFKNYEDIAAIRPPCLFKYPLINYHPKIYVMENIYHYKITAISEETLNQTVTNRRQGLNVLPFDPKNDQWNN